MKNTLFDHCGDIHLMARQYGTRKRSEEIFEAFARYVRHVAHRPEGEKSSCIVCAGDLLNERRPPSHVIDHLMRIDALLRDFKLPMLVVSGNHDWSDPNWFDTLFSRNTIEGGGIIPLDGKAVEIDGTRYFGLPQTNAGGFPGMVERHQAELEQADVVVFHGAVSGVVPCLADPDLLIPTSALLEAAPNAVAWALGDLHVTGYVYHEGVLFGYPGSIEMCSSSESTDKYATQIRVTDDRAEVARQDPLKIRPFFSESVTTQEEADSLIKRLQAVSDQYPIVVVKYAPELDTFVDSVYSMLDPQRCILRLTALPRSPELREAALRATKAGVDTLEDFVKRRFSGGGLQAKLAVALLTNPQDAANLVSEFIDNRLAELESA